MNVPGGIVDTVLPNDVRRFYKNQLESYKKIVCIFNTKMQIVAGTLYYFDVVVHNKRKCKFRIYHVVILSQLTNYPKYIIQEKNKICEFRG